MSTHHPAPYVASYATPPDVIPPFLDRRATPTEPPKPYLLALQRLSAEDAELLWARIAPTLPPTLQLPGCVSQAEPSRRSARRGDAARPRSQPHSRAQRSGRRRAGGPDREAHHATGDGQACVVPALRLRKRVAASSSLDETLIVRLLVAENPKRRGNDPYERFAQYRDGMTVRAARRWRVARQRPLGRIPRLHSPRQAGGTVMRCYLIDPHSRTIRECDIPSGDELDLRILIGDDCARSMLERVRGCTTAMRCSTIVASGASRNSSSATLLY